MHVSVRISDEDREWLERMGGPTSIIKEQIKKYKESMVDHFPCQKATEILETLELNKDEELLLEELDRAVMLYLVRRVTESHDHFQATPWTNDQIDNTVNFELLLDELAKNVMRRVELDCDINNRGEYVPRGK